MFLKWLPIRDQRNAAVVCRRWNAVLLSPGFRYGRMLAVFRLSQLQPQFTDFQLPPIKGNTFKRVSRCGPVALFHGVDTVYHLHASGEAQAFVLKGFLTEEEAKNPALAGQSIQTALLLSEDECVTVWNRGTVVWWKLGQTVAQCTGRLQLYRQTTEPAQVKEAAICQGKLYVSCVNVTFPISETRVVGEPRLDQWCIQERNSTLLFGDFSAEGHALSAKSLDLTRKWTTFVSETEFRVIQCTDKIVVVANCITDNYITDRKSHSKTGINFFIYNAEDGRCDAMYLSRRVVGLPRDFGAQEHWYRGDFIFSLIGTAIDIYHAPKRDWLTTIPLTKLLGETPIPLSSNYQPILDVHFEGKYLQVFVQMPDGHLRIVQWDLSTHQALPRIPLVPVNLSWT
ncbi:MAG TPA: hypothetical protein VMR37_02020 [Rhabdochlamydiaceae bacterium]|nr:hypothetical protein [Rhabdochlamydiaceae bacterium]